MKFLTKLKRWLGLAPKPVDPIQTAPKGVEQPLPNGRVAITDEKGNFVGFKNKS